MKQLVIFSYRGSHYHGYQKQESQPFSTIQEMVEEVLSEIYQTKIDLSPAGRTDRGVHADEQLAIFEDPKGMGQKIGFDKLPQIINQKLPSDIRVWEVREVEQNFNPRYDGRVRWYRYHLKIQKYGLKNSALDLDEFYPVKFDIDRENLQACFEVFLGKKDFSAFSSSTESEAPVNPVRSMYQVVVGQRGDVVWIDLFANAFLRGMVRSIVGNTLYLYREQQSNEGKVSIAEVKIIKDKLHSILASKDSTLAKHRVPPNGLVLKRVFYQPIFNLINK